MEYSLTHTPIPVLIRKIALPTAIGLLFNTLFNIVDTYYGGQISTNSLAALSVSFPLFFLFIAFGFGYASAATALIGRTC